MELRPYQEQCLSQSLEGFNTFSKQLVCAPTGSGKAVIMAKMAEAFLPKRTLMLCNREELVYQAAQKLKAATGIDGDIEKAELRASLSSPVVVASIQSMQGSRLERWPEDHFGLVICDEAHRSTADSWQRTLNRFDKTSKVWGCTATPQREDHRQLGNYYENIAFEISLLDLINQGYLSRIVITSLPITIDLRSVRQSGGDYDERDLDKAITPWFCEIARALKEHAPFRRTLVFLPLVATSRAFVEVCKEEGIEAVHVDGNSPDRKEILRDFAAGRYELCSNSALLVEGFDDPGIDCILMLRPTKSNTLYQQCVGRGTRIAPFKQNLLLLDFLYEHERHALVRPAHLIASCENQAEAMTAIAQERAKFGQQELDLEVLSNEETVKREATLRKQLKEKAKRDAKTVDAMEWCLQMGAHDVVDYEPVMQWEHNPVTPKQAAVLKRAKIDLSTVRGKGHASKLLNIYFAQQKTIPASPKVKELMRRMGSDKWECATAEEGRKFMAKLNVRRAA